MSPRAREPPATSRWSRAGPGGWGGVGYLARSMISTSRQRFAAERGRVSATRTRSPKIGRASCRERGEVAGGAGRLKERQHGGGGGDQQQNSPHRRYLRKHAIQR